MTETLTVPWNYDEQGRHGSAYLEGTVVCAISPGEPPELYPRDGSAPYPGHGPDVQVAEDSVRVTELETRHGTVQRGEHPGPARLDNVAARLIEADPDFVDFVLEYAAERCGQ